METFEGTSPGRFGRLTLLRPIARGGMGQVWSAETPAGEACVVKLLRAALVDDAQARRRFVAEAELLARLHHPAIVRVIEQGEVDGRLYVALEHIEGVPLRSLMNAVARRGRVLPPAAASRIAGEIASALHHAHSSVDANGAPLGIVHRDVSPQNVMVCFDGAVKLIDFGLATWRDRRDAGATAVHGTFPYMSPEQAAGEPVDARGDIYAAAVVLYELLTGGPFFGGLLVEQAVERLARGYVPPGLTALDKPVADVVGRALAPRPDRRYESVAAFATALARALPPCSQEELGALVEALVSPHP